MAVRQCVGRTRIGGSTEESSIRQCGNCRGFEAVRTLGAERCVLVKGAYHDENVTLSCCRKLGGSVAAAVVGMYHSFPASNRLPYPLPQLCSTVSEVSRLVNNTVFRKKQRHSICEFTALFREAYSILTSFKFSCHCSTSACSPLDFPRQTRSIGRLSTEYCSRLD